jgi:hypothetical protein
MVTARAADNKNLNPAAALPAPPAIDPATGLPLPLPTSPAPKEWKDPNWKDPDITLTNVIYDRLPLSEVARDLRDKFKDYFDVLMPKGWRDPRSKTEVINPESFDVNLQLKNVTASEVFGAMNLVFETENTPVRWELMINGTRPTAVLRVLPELVPFDPNQPPPPAEPKRMIYFVGDLIGDEKSSGMTMEQIARTVSVVYQMAYGPSARVRLQFHQEAQLLVVTGTPEEIGFVQNALSALRQKARLDAERKAHTQSPESKPKSDATQTP